MQRNSRTVAKIFDVGDLKNVFYLFYVFRIGEQFLKFGRVEKLGPKKKWVLETLISNL